jgi:hypothetical protein
MTTEQVVDLLRHYEGRRVLLTWVDGVTRMVDVHSVDDEGVLHSGDKGEEPAKWWTRFDSISSVEPLSTDS